MQSASGKGLHVAIIMDGNGRWATRRGLPRLAGHRAGVATARRVVERAPDVGIRWLTLYAFSSDNWRRPADEVKTIFWLLQVFLRLETARLRERGAQLQVIGRRDRLPSGLLQEIVRAERATAMGRRIQVRVAIDYSSREAIARAAARMSHDPLADEANLSDKLGSVLSETSAADSGDVDLLIRTGGEKRLSDFLLWESAYAELFFTDRMWPDFDVADLDAALLEFRGRDRRFGAVPASRAQYIATTSGSKETLCYSSSDRPGRP
jgi:undecaprenyl diphosphate synthase